MEHPSHATVNSTEGVMFLWDPPPPLTAVTPGFMALQGRLTISGKPFGLSWQMNGVPCFPSFLFLGVLLLYRRSGGTGDLTLRWVTPSLFPAVRFSWKPIPFRFFYQPQPAALCPAWDFKDWFKRSIYFFGISLRVYSTYKAQYK